MPHTKEDSWEIKDLSEKTIYSLEYNAGEYLCDLGAEDFLKKKTNHKAQEKLWWVQSHQN